MATDPKGFVTRQQFAGLCEQMVRLASYLEALDVQRDPDGPSGWELREITEIKQRILELLPDQGAGPEEPRQCDDA